MLKRSLSFLLGVYAVLFVLHYALVINRSASFPEGVYLRTYQPFSRGELVLACPEDREEFRYARERGMIGYGLCPGRYGYLIKRVAAMEGDMVSFSEKAVCVNGQPLENSARRPDIPFRVEGSAVLHDEVLLMSEHPKSFDGRYFGSVKQQSVITTIRPLFLWR